jgi:hypothetical protein
VRFASEGGGAHPRRWIWTWMMPRALGLASLVAAIGAGCTQPQSGVFDGHWCRPGAADGQPYVMLDDMEDGDSVPCSGVGKWTVGGSADFAPTGETVGGPAIPALLTDTDRQVLDPMFEMLAPAGFADTFRAHHLQGTIAAGGYGSLILPAATDLSAFPELDFWARTDTGAATVLVGIFTADGSYFSEKVSIRSAWDTYSAPLLGALFRTDGAAVTAADLAATTQIELRFQGDLNGNPPSFGFWFDDVVLKR